MKKLLILAITIILAIAFTVPAFAFMKGEKVFETKMGKVTFSIDNHKAAGKKCGDCHTAAFDRKKGAAGEKMKAPHEAGVGCGVCHKEVKSKCNLCHKK